MQNQEQFLMVVTTCPDNETAHLVANKIIERSLAACVNILPEVVSIYQWKGERQQGTEHILLIKTEKSRYTELQNLITESHPYELPEVIAVPISEALPEYLSWIKSAILDSAIDREANKLSHEKK